MSEIKFTIDSDARVSPIAPQMAGVKGDDNICVITYDISALTDIISGDSIRIEVSDGCGGFHSSENLSVDSGEVSWVLPAEITISGGVAQIHLIITRISNEVEKVRYSFPARIYFEESPIGTYNYDKYKGTLSGLALQAKEDADSAKASADDATIMAASASTSAEASMNYAIQSASASSTANTYAEEAKRAAQRVGGLVDEHNQDSNAHPTIQRGIMGAMSELEGELKAEIKETQDDIEELSTELKADLTHLDSRLSESIAEISDNFNDVVNVEESVANNILKLTDVAQTTKNGVTYSIVDGVISAEGTATGGNVSINFGLNASELVGDIYFSKDIDANIRATWDGQSEKTMPMGLVTISQGITSARILITDGNTVNMHGHFWANRNSAKPYDKYGEIVKTIGNVKSEKLPKGINGYKYGSDLCILGDRAGQGGCIVGDEFFYCATPNIGYGYLTMVNIYTGNIRSKRLEGTGHMNDSTFCDKDGYVYVANMTDDGLIIVIDPITLTEVRRFTVNDHTGNPYAWYAIAYDFVSEMFILVDDTGFSMYDSSFNYVHHVNVEIPTKTKQGIATDGRRIYWALNTGTQGNYTTEIKVYDFNGDLYDSFIPYEYDKYREPESVDFDRTSGFMYINGNYYNGSVHKHEIYITAYPKDIKQIYGMFDYKNKISTI